MWIEIVFKSGVSSSVLVILYARMWIEIMIITLNLLILSVILYARMWIEMSNVASVPVLPTGHPLCEDVD